MGDRFSLIFNRGDKSEGNKLVQKRELVCISQVLHSKQKKTRCGKIDQRSGTCQRDIISLPILTF